MIVINFVLKRNKNYGKISIENLNEKGVRNIKSSSANKDC